METFPELQKPEKATRAPKTYSVTLKKAAFIDGKKLGNIGGVIEVDGDTLKQLKRSGVIDENSK